MIVLIDPRNPATRIELTGEFAADDAEVLLRTWPELRRSKAPDQIPMFDAAGDVMRVQWNEEEA